MRLLGTQRHRSDERLLWTRDVRFAHRLARAVAGARHVELDAGSCVIAPADRLTESRVQEIARSAHDPDYGLIAVDASLPPDERLLRAFSAAVQLSGIADRIGMARTTQIAQTKVLDHFFVLRSRHEVHFQPVVDLTTGRAHEHECLFRPCLPTLPTTIGAIVQAAIDTDRSVELDTYLVGRILERAAELADRAEDRLRLAINLTPASLLAPGFEAHALADRVRAAGLVPAQVTVECTEQQAVADVEPLRRRVKRLRRVGFGFAIDDAGAGYASFTLIAALRPSVIKIDRQIVTGVAVDDAKQALVESFVSFAQRIDARLIAEGIDRRRDLARLVDLGVELGQGYLLGRPAPEPRPPRRLDTLAPSLARALASDPAGPASRG